MAGYDFNNEAEQIDEQKIFSEQWERLTKAANVTTDAELAKLLNITPPSVTGVKKREKIPLDWFQQVAEMFCVSLDWLILGRSGTAPCPQAQVQSDRELVVYPRRYRTSISGFGYDIDTKAHRLGINKTYLEQYASEEAFFIRMPDNSMYPYFKSNDILLIDPSYHTYEVGGHYAITWGEQMIVRRYDIKPDKIVFTTISDRYESIEIDMEDKKHWPRLVGKVVWMAREYW